MAVLDVLGGVASLLSKGIDLFADDDKQKAKILLQQINALQEQNTAQATVNAHEAKHASLFVAGWRPAIGWVCAVAIAFSFIVKPYLFPFLYGVYPSLAALPEVDGNLFELVLGMLGLAGLRSFEKRAGISR